MLLAIDIGNTNTLFAVINDEGKILTSIRITTNKDRTEDEYIAFIKPLLEYNITDVLVSSVVVQANYAIKKLCSKYLQITAKFVNDNISSLPISIDIRNPNELGMDRIVNSIAAFNSTKTSTIVIDFGTATTFDVISEDGSYCGGVIAAGVNLILESLGSKTSKLPYIDIKKPPKAIGKDTVSAMQSGIFLGYIGLIENIISSIKNEQKIDKIIATGGLAKLFSQHFSIIDYIDEDLTLYGIFLIHKHL